MSRSFSPVRYPPPFVGRKTVTFRCPSCGYQAFRYRPVYEQLIAARGRATCLLCPPSASVAPPPRQELLAVAQALNALARDHLSTHRHLAVATRSSPSRVLFPGAVVIVAPAPIITRMRAPTGRLVV